VFKSGSGIGGGTAGNDGKYVYGYKTAEGKPPLGGEVGCGRKENGVRDFSQKIKIY